eukprot:gene27230-32897_t
MSYKQDKYSKRDDFDEFESISERLAADLRKSIRQLDNFPILSDPWFEMAETFGRVANISDVESSLPSAKKEGTLWETEEQALRFLLEDGKLNLCLRSLIEFKAKQIEARHNNGGPMIEFVAECDKFEKGVGVIMKNAWQHVEVLQTTDLPALVQHIAAVLEGALALPDVMEGLLKKSDMHQRQEVLVFYYLNGLFRHVEDIREHRVMPVVREQKIFMLAVKALCQYGGQIQTAHRFVAAQALALLAETEDFATHRDAYYGEHAGDVDRMVQLKESMLSELAGDFERRKAIRPLLDCIDRAKRMQKK